MANAEVIMPKMGDGMDSGTLLSWLKQDGEQVSVGDFIAEIETDKANVSIEAEDAGVLRTQIKPGESVPVGTVIAVIGDGKALVPSANAPVVNQVAAPPPVAQAVPAPVNPIRNGGARLKVSPLARRVARDRGVALEQVRGTGPNGRIIEADIVAFAGGQSATAPKSATVPAKPSAPATPSEGATIVELSAMRRAIARRMVESKTTIPHFYLTVEIDMEAALDLRKQLNGYDEGLQKISLNDFVVKASALALKKVPAVNRLFQNDKIVQPASINVGIAVALDDGLIVPVVPNTDTKSLRKIAGEAKQLIDKARNRRLQPAEYTGGTFTVTNLGTFDVENFIAIIDPSQGAILAVGSIRKLAVVMPDDTIKPRQRMNVTLSGDHRAMDGATGAKFLQELKRILQNPLSLLEQ